jgi:hypothetical protein
MRGVPVRLEDELRAALRHEAAPEGFAAKVLARTAGGESRKNRVWVPAIAAALIVAGLTPEAVHQYRERRRGIEARDELITALSITRAQLEHAKEKIRGNTRHER